MGFCCNLCSPYHLRADMADQPSVPRDKYRDNQNVPIVAERLLAAIQFRGLSVKAAAERAGEKQQTVQRIAQGQTSKCRHSRRQRLAEALEVPDEWLGGADVPPIPGLPAGRERVLEAEGFQVTTVLDENLAHFPAGASTLPPAYQLEWSRLTQRFLEAWQRDMDEGIEDALTLAELFSGSADDPVDAKVAVSHLLQRAMSARWWRQRLLLPITLPEAPSDLDELSDEERSALALKNEQIVRAQSPGVSRDELDDFGRLEAEALGLILEPWLEGVRSLDYQAMYILLYWLRRGMLLGVPPGLPSEAE